MAETLHPAHTTHIPPVCSKGELGVTAESWVAKALSQWCSHSGDTGESSSQHRSDHTPPTRSKGVSGELEQMVSTTAYSQSRSQLGGSGVISHSTQMAGIKGGSGESTDSTTQHSLVHSKGVSGEGSHSKGDSTLNANTPSKVMVCTPAGEKYLSSQRGHKNDFWVKLHQKVSRTKGPNAFGAKISIPTPINHKYLEESLKEYQDNQIVEFLKYGWPVGAEGEVKMDQKVWPRNHDSALDFPEAIEDFIRKGFEADSMIGPFDANPFNCSIGVSPLATREKNDSDERRVFMNMSSPKYKSVNDLISKKDYLGERYTLTYPKVDDLVEMIKVKGRGCALFKRDLKAAYRQLLRVDPKDIPLLGFVWKGKLYFDLTQPQGSRSAAMQCQRCSTAVKYIYDAKHQDFDLVNYLDDFGAAEFWSLVYEAYKVLGEILEKAGIVESVPKQCKPSTSMTFLGVGLDTEKLIMYITAERLAAIRKDLIIWSNKTESTKKEIQSIAGTLGFVAVCVPSSRIFLSRIYALMKSMPETGRHHLSRDFKLDIQWWSRFMEQYNGVSMMLLEEWSHPDAVMASDACLIGCGAWFGAHRLYYHTVFPPCIKERFPSKHHISQLELLAVVLTMKVWGHLLAGLRVVIYCDNEGAVAAINHHRAHEDFMQLCSRELNFVCAKFSFQIRAEHIEGVENRIPDFLSRWNIDNCYQNRFLSEIGPTKAIEHMVTQDMFQFAEDW